ncbi:hypothetical protein RI054_16g77460 [Pseudoscourfieldia marina]
MPGMKACDDAPPNGVDGEFVAVAAGGYHSLALRSDGTIACWGHNGDGQAPPDGVAGDFVAIAAGSTHSLAIRRDGSIACWGANDDGQVPPDGVAGEFVAIAAIGDHSLAIRRDAATAISRSGATIPMARRRHKACKVTFDGGATRRQLHVMGGLQRRLSRIDGAAR